jgi:hypothetical protein
LRRYNSETVTPYNIERLQKLVENGPHPPPGETGAKYIIREAGAYTRPHLCSP